jgi:hypothetical protein
MRFLHIKYIKYISKNIHYILLFILILLTVISLYHSFYKKEYFIGKKDSNDNIILSDELKAEKKNYTHFPPSLKDKSKYDLLNNIFGDSGNVEDVGNAENTNNINNIKNTNNTNDRIKDIPISLPETRNVGKQELEKGELQKSVSKIDENKPLLGSCDFYFNKCPNNKSSMATIKGKNLTCGKSNIESKKAEAVAQIKNGHISKIIITNAGNGYNYQNPPKVNIQSSSGNGASAIVKVNKDGTISSIDVLDYGYGYVETPNIDIEAPQMDGVCHLCC